MEALGTHWLSFFPLGQDSPASTAVPAQAARLIATAHTKLEGDMAQCMDTRVAPEERTSAKAAMAVALANGKKRVLDAGL